MNKPSILWYDIKGGLLCRMGGMRRMDRKKLRQILVISTLIIAIYFLFLRVGDVLGVLRTVVAILLPFVIGGILAFTFNVPLRFFENRVFRFMDKHKALKKCKRPLALLIVFSLVFAILYLLMSLVIPQLKTTIVNIINAMQGFIARLDVWLADYDISISQFLGDTIKLPTTEEMNMELGKTLELLLKGVAFSGSLIGTVYDNILSVFFTVMFTFYFLFAKERLVRQCGLLMKAFLKPELGQRIVYIARLTQRTFHSFITGQCLEALILGGLFFLFMTIFSMPYALLISLFIAVMALIPVIGAWAGCIVGALLILMVNPITALWFVVMFLVLQQIEGNLIYPHVMGNAIGLPSIWVLFAVVLGEGLMGILGMLLFIPLTSVMYTLLREEVDRRLAKTPQPMEN